MKREIKVTHIFDDGRAMTDKEFFASPVEISVDNNMGFVKECAKVLNPAYRVADRIARRWERIEKRKARLLKQQQEIAKQLAEIV